jgi:hypothetical protein
VTDSAWVRPSLELFARHHNAAEFDCEINCFLESASDWLVWAQLVGCRWGRCLMQACQTGIRLGGHSTREVAAAIRDIDDDQNAAAWLERVFEGAVVAKPQFRNRSGREFRRAFRAAGR